MEAVEEILNNREIATIIWVLIFAVWALSQKNIRTSMKDVFRALFAKQILIIIGSMLVYIAFMIVVLNNVGFWDASKLKDTIVWTFGVAFVMLVNASKASDDDQFFRKVIIDNIKLVLVLEFIVNIYSFGIIAELIMLPVVTLLMLMKTVAEFKTEHKKAVVIIDYALIIFGTAIIFLTFRKIITDFHSFSTFDNLHDFLLTPVFTIVYLPFIYFTALFMKYENVFVRVGFFNNDSQLASLIKRKIFTLCHLDLWKLMKCSKDLNILRARNRDDLLDAIQEFKGTFV